MLKLLYTLIKISGKYFGVEIWILMEAKLLKNMINSFKFP